MPISLIVFYVKSLVMSMSCDALIFLCSSATLTRHVDFEIVKYLLNVLAVESRLNFIWLVYKCMQVAFAVSLMRHVEF